MVSAVLRASLTMASACARASASSLSDSAFAVPVSRSAVSCARPRIFAALMCESSLTGAAATRLRRRLVHRLRRAATGSGSGSGCWYCGIDWVA